MTNLGGRALPDRTQRRHAVSQIDPKRLGKAGPPGGGDRQRAAVTAALDPGEVEAALQHTGADRAGDMRAPLAPVETGPAEHPLRPLPGAELDAEPGEEPRPALGDFAAILGEDDMAAPGQRVGNRDPEPPGDMVI